MDSVEVTGADRKIAWPLRPSCYPNNAKKDWFAGAYDKLPTLQAYARHRLATEQAIVDWIRKGFDADDLARWIADAIQAQEHRP